MLQYRRVRITKNSLNSRDRGISSLPGLIGWMKTLRNRNVFIKNPAKYALSMWFLLYSFLAGKDKGKASSKRWPGDFGEKRPTGWAHSYHSFHLSEKSGVTLIPLYHISSSRQGVHLVMSHVSEDCTWSLSWESTCCLQSGYTWDLLKRNNHKSGSMGSTFHSSW